VSGGFKYRPLPLEEDSPSVRLFLTTVIIIVISSVASVVTEHSFIYYRAEKLK